MTKSMTASAAALVKQAGILDRTPREGGGDCGRVAPCLEACRAIVDEMVEAHPELSGRPLAQGEVAERILTYLNAFGSPIPASDVWGYLTRRPLGYGRRLWQEVRVVKRHLVRAGMLAPNGLSGRGSRWCITKSGQQAVNALHRGEVDIESWWDTVRRKARG